MPNIRPAIQKRNPLHANDANSPIHTSKRIKMLARLAEGGVVIFTAMVISASVIVDHWATPI
jgi:hypothetical protein